MEALDQAQEYQTLLNATAQQSRVRVLDVPVPPGPVICEDCDEEIDRRRIEAYAAATRCVLCENDYQKRKGAYR